MKSASRLCTLPRGFIVVAGNSKKSQAQPSKDSDPPPRITSNVKQNLQFLKLWKEYQKRNSSTPKPATSYRRKREEKEDLPPDTELYKDPTLSLYHTNQIVDCAVPVLLVDGYNVCGYWVKLKKYFMNGRLDVARQKLVDELVQFSLNYLTSSFSRAKSVISHFLYSHQNHTSEPSSPVVAATDGPQ